jgi:hypothetical protein
VAQWSRELVGEVRMITNILKDAYPGPGIVCSGSTLYRFFTLKEQRDDVRTSPILERRCQGGTGESHC